MAEARVVIRDGIDKWARQNLIFLTAAHKASLLTECDAIIAALESADVPMVTAERGTFRGKLGTIMGRAFSQGQGHIGRFNPDDRTASAWIDLDSADYVKS